jgi:hypothetical protein
MRIVSTIILCVVFSFSYAQKSVFLKFGKINAQHLADTKYAIDSGANAVVLSDIGETAVEGNSKGWFSVVFTRHRVVHILNKSGYNEADVSINLYKSGLDEEKLESVKAVTYNLENGKVVETKLEKSAIFKDKSSNKLTVCKFTFPNVKEGSIIEYEYRMTSDFISNLDPWYFQGSSPVLWSEYRLSVPQFLIYNFLSSGYHPIAVNERSDRTGSFTVVDTHSATASDRTTFSAGITDYRWAMKDVPEMKPESFTSTIRNHISRMEFQLTGFSSPLTPKDFRTSWASLIKELNESDEFGAALSKSNSWMSEEVKPIIAGASGDEQKAKKIFEFVRDHYACTEHNALWASQPIKNIQKIKKGSVSEINLLLTGMLRYAGLDASPVILSTKDHGYAHEMYPMMTSFNYVVTKFRSNGKDIYLDASQPGLGYGRLLPECYNGHARVVNEAADAVYFQADSLKERAVTALLLTGGKNGWIGTMTQEKGYYESMTIRKKVQESGKEKFFEGIGKAYGANISISEEHIDSLSNPDEPVLVSFTVEIKPGQDDIIYFDPMFGEAMKKNPFQSAERLYPVEMPYTFDETYLLTMNVPEGYEVDELPRQMIARIDENGSANFEYRISVSGSTISLRSTLKTKKTMFLPDEYEALREFFNLVVKKQNEQIVFKKKK